MNKLFLISLIFLLLPFTIFAQTAEELDILLETKAVSVEKAARFVLGAVGLLPEELHGEEAEYEAYQMALSNGWVKKAATDEVTLKDLSFLVMNAFNFKGGIFYSVFKNPRYAYREMLYRKLIHGRSDPSFAVSGNRLLQILSSALSYSGENDLTELQSGGNI